MDSEDSGHSESMDSDQSEASAEMEGPAEPAEDPAAAAAAAAAAIAAFVAPLVGEFAAAVGATKQLQQLRSRPQPEALQSLLLHWINSVDPATILAQRGRFASLSGAMLKLVQSECARMRRPPLVSLVVTNQTQDLVLNLNSSPPRNQGWTMRHLKSLCTDIVRECKTTLRSLDITNRNSPGGDNPGLPAVMLTSLLEQLSGLDSVHVDADYQDYEVDHLLSVLTRTNPGIRDLAIPRLSTENLHSIAQTWPQLEWLDPGDSEFDVSEVAAVLPGLRNLEYLGIHYKVLSEAMLLVARAHDPATPAYKLDEWFYSTGFGPLLPGDMASLFTAFPELTWLWVLDAHVPALCAALQGRDQVKVTKLTVHTTSENPRALEPLLVRVGKHLTVLDMEEGEGRVDLGMIGHHCPKLEELNLWTRELVCDEDFVVTPAFFARLRDCSVHHESQDGPAELPPPLVHALTCSPTLEKLSLRGVPLTEEMVNGLAAEREAHGALTSLKTVSVDYHPGLSLRTLVTLVSHAPKLTYVWIDYHEAERAAALEMKQRLGSFIQQSGLLASV